MMARRLGWSLAAFRADVWNDERDAKSNTEGNTSAAHLDDAVVTWGWTKVVVCCGSPSVSGAFGSANVVSYRGRA